MVFLCRHSGSLRVRHIQVACCSRTGHTTRLLACDGKHRCYRNLYTRRATQSSQRKTPSALFCALILLRQCCGSAPYSSQGLYAPGLTRALLKKAKVRASPYAYVVRRRWRLLAWISRVGGGALFIDGLRRGHPSCFTAWVRRPLSAPVSLRGVHGVRR